MKLTYLAPVVLVVLAAAFLAPALADPPADAKWVANLTADDVRVGQVIINTNPEDDGTLELEVEVEECLALNESIVDVYLNGEWIGNITIDEFGDGKATFYVGEIEPTDEYTVTVEGDDTLTSAEWREWQQGRGKK
jgi:hypothetical protein